jgi:D-erythronate 2-dehydrogenase
MRVLVIGSEGFIGQTLVRRLRAGAKFGARGATATRIVRLDVRMPADAPGSGARERCIAGDITDPAVLESALAGGIDCVFHLASVPGGAAERDFALGLRVNLQSGISLLEALRQAGNRPLLVFASTIGVYGVPMPTVIDEDTVPAPSLSYGAHKYVSEVLIADYSRRGYLDGRSLRLPGIVARPPTAGMLSIFLSDVIRELSAGRSVVCPVAPDAPSWWMSRSCAVDNLLHATALEAAPLPPSRSFLLPVQRLTMAEVVQAIAALHGAQVLERVSYRPDAALQQQFANYPPLHAPRAVAAGFRHDGDAMTLVRRALED